MKAALLFALVAASRCVGSLAQNATGTPASNSACSGSKDPSGPYPLCYEGSAGALGLKEDVKVKISSFASGKGTMDLSGSGIETISCTGKSFTKSGQAITVAVGDCDPDIQLKSVLYCSDTDTISASVLDAKVIDLPLAFTLARTTTCSTADAGAASFAAQSTEGATLAN